MLNLTKTPQLDNQVSFLVKIFKQGANVLTNGIFSSSTGWTTGGDWNIASGSAYYYYDDDTSGTLSQSSLSTDTDIYIFEYTVLANDDETVTLILDSSVANSIVDDDVSLETTLGVHSIKVLSNGGSVLALTADGFSLAGDTLRIDNLSLRKANDYIRASSKTDVTIGSYTYSGGLLFQESGRVLGEITKQVDITGGGSIGSLESFDFSISNFSSYFINDFYPNNGEPDLSGARVELYAVWNNLSYASEEEMLLLNVYYINENYNENNKMNFFSIEYSDIESEDLPRYQVQKDFDDGISYYPYASNEALGTPIPIVYGSFNEWNPVPVHSTATKEGYVLTPAILVNEAKLEFVVSSHQCKTDNWNKHGKSGDTNIVFKYLKGVNTYMLCFKVGDSASGNINAHSGYTFKLMYTAGRIYGDLYMKFNQVSSETKQTEIEDAIDIDPLTYSQIDRFEISATNKLAVSIEGKESTANVGYLSSNYTVVFAIKLEDDSTGNYRIGRTDNTGSSPSSAETSTVSMAGATVTEKTYANTDAIDIEKLCNYEYYIVNYGADTVGKKINVYYGYVKTLNINVTGLTFRQTGYGRIATPNMNGMKVIIIGGFRR